MTLNLTINEAPGATPPVTPGSYQVRAFYSETDAGHVYGPFGTREQAEATLTVLAARSGVVKAVIEPAGTAP